jgi:protein BCP1
LQDKPVIKDLITYIQRKASKPGFAPLQDLLSLPSPPAIGLVLTERLINIPAEVVPPMYTMLLEEIGWALEENEPYDFTHYLILSRTYEEVTSKLDQEEVRPQKKKKKAKNGKGDVFYFHPEDEVFQRHALCYGNFTHTHQQPEGYSDSKRAFQEVGIRPQGHMILLEASKFEAAVADVREYLEPPS